MSFRERLDKYLEWTLVVLMSLLVVDVLWQVISRYVLTAPSSFTDELAGFLLIWVGLLGSAYVTGKNEHLAIDMLLQRSGEKRQRILRLIIHILIAVFALFVLIIGGAWLVYTRFYLNVNSAALRIPLGYVYLILPLSGLIVLYYTLDNTKKIFLNRSLA
ncbi:MAG: TRAP transporter small permease [Cyclobacteriaceae bacterium]|nr:TRAP transporter small permease [Cyclobacteriaceae bacterium]UYN85726.1 MAG: TRAP transporter small permease [Cyclobacteriaceae bacterium]